MLSAVQIYPVGFLFFVVVYFSFFYNFKCINGTGVDLCQHTAQNQRRALYTRNILAVDAKMVATRSVPLSEADVCSPKKKKMGVLK